MKEGQVVKKEQKAVVAISPNEMIQLALNQNADLDKLDKLLDTQIKWEKNEAQKAYTVAMAAFKANPPKINKDKDVKIPHKSGSGKTCYSHASLANVAEKINASLSEHGLSAAWHTDQKENKIIVTCRITHKQGHSEETTLFAPADTTGLKNTIQQIASTITYLQRYTILSLTGLAASDMDDDAKTSDAEYITGDDLQDIRAKSMKYKVDEAIFLKYIGAESFDKINVKDYGKTIMALEEKRKQNESKGAK